ncbi:MAG TPA: superoxide dismutase [Alphaproteobacteria bacterium]|jgi:Fe-Mn family superoxide dismutase
MPLIQAPLPYDKQALEPHMSGRTLDFHYGKHHKAYVDNTNASTKGTALENADLAAIIKSAKDSGDRKLFNNSAQVWNHEFFWQSMTPKAAAPTGKLAEWLARDFGGLDQFKQAFKAEGLGHFASGWAWLVLEGGKLKITSYHDADTPLVHDGVVPLLTADVWEHAYYLDHQNARANFLDAFLNHLADWQGAARKLDAAQ